MTTTPPSDILSLSVRDFVRATAAKSPTPGGGSVAALAGALGAALAQMSVNYSIGKKSLEAHRPELEAALARLGKAGALLLELVTEDMAAYEALSALGKLPKEQRAASTDYLTALGAAIAVPESIGAVAANILDLCESLFDRTNPFLYADLVAAAALANAAARAAELNVLANVPLVPDAAEAQQIRERAAELLGRSDATYVRIRAHFATKV